MFRDKASNRVLIVDDEVVIADTLRRIFISSGYEARASHSAEEAMEIVAEWPPDLMIIDVILPGMNGIELAVKLQEQFPDCRILLFSGQAATTDLLTASEARGHSFEILAKPIPPGELLDAALRLLMTEKPTAPVVEISQPVLSHGTTLEDGTAPDELPVD